VDVVVRCDEGFGEPRVGLETGWLSAQNTPRVASAVQHLKVLVTTSASGEGSWLQGQLVVGAAVL